MSSADAVAQQAASLVVRSRAGDENASALLYRIGEEARKGRARAAQAYEAVRAYIARNPARPFQLGSETAILMDGPPDEPTSGAIELAPQAPTSKDIERRKPTLPRGAFDRIFEPDWTALVILRACQYRYGLPAAAVVLACGPLITSKVLREFGASNFGSEESTALFFFGVKNPSEASWREVAPHLEPPLRRCLAIGQCFGRARRIQEVRRPGSSISAYNEGAGWELGES